MVTGLKLRAAHFGALHSLSSVYSWQCLTVQMVNLSFDPDHNHVEIMSVLSPIMERYNRTNETLTVSNLSISIESACRGGGGNRGSKFLLPIPFNLSSHPIFIASYLFVHLSTAKCYTIFSFLSCFLPSLPLLPIHPPTSCLLHQLPIDSLKGF